MSPPILLGTGVRHLRNNNSVILKGSIRSFFSVIYTTLVSRLTPPFKIHFYECFHFDAAIFHFLFTASISHSVSVDASISLRLNYCVIRDHAQASC